MSAMCIPKTFHPAFPFCLPQNSIDNTMVTRMGKITQKLLWCHWWTGVYFFWHTFKAHSFDQLCYYFFKLKGGEEAPERHRVNSQRGRPKTRSGGRRLEESSIPTTLPLLRGHPGRLRTPRVPAEHGSSKRWEAYCKILVCPKEAPSVRGHSIPRKHP